MKRVEIEKGYFVEMPINEINSKNKKAVQETIFRDGRDWSIKTFYGWLKRNKKYKFINYNLSIHYKCLRKIKRKEGIH